MCTLNFNGISSLIIKMASSFVGRISSRSALKWISGESSRILSRQFSSVSSSPLMLSASASSSKLSSISLNGPTFQQKFSTKAGSDEIVEFLKEEIAAEKQNLRNLPTMEGFEVKKEGAELTLTKKYESEKIMVTLNVNHSVDSAVPDDGSQEAPEMKSKPNFEVDIIKSNGKTLSFSCSYVSDEGSDELSGNAGQESDDSDVFAIDEVTMFQGDDTSDHNYAVAGDILDGYLYDLFMNMLEDRGIDAKFADDLSEFCSAYEHSQYINMLEELQKFVKM